MKNILLLLTLIFIISCKKENTTQLTEKAVEYLEYEKFDKALKINKKLIEENPESYYYFVQRGLILEILENDKEAQNYYSKAREKFYLKEESYWKKYDSVSMAGMLLEIGDSARSREIIKLVIRNKTFNFPESELNKYFNLTHGEILEKVKFEILSEKVEIKTESENIENILEDRN